MTVLINSNLKSTNLTNIFKIHTDWKPENYKKALRSKVQCVVHFLKHERLETSSLHNLGDLDASEIGEKSSHTSRGMGARKKWNRGQPLVKNIVYTGLSLNTLLTAWNFLRYGVMRIYCGLVKLGPPTFLPVKVKCKKSPRNINPIGIGCLWIENLVISYFL